MEPEEKEKPNTMPIEEFNKMHDDQKLKNMEGKYGFRWRYEEGMVAKTEPLTRERLKSLYGIE